MMGAPMSILGLQVGTVACALEKRHQIEATNCRHGPD